MEEIAAARNFAPTQSVVQIVGTCEECRTGRESPAIDGTTTDRVFARDALRMAIATERSGLEFYTRAASLTKDRRGRAVFQKLAAEEREHLGTLQKRYAALAASDPQLESRPTFLFFKGAASGLFAAGAKELHQRGERPAGAAHRHPVRARIARVLQALRRTLRGFRGEAGVSRVRGRRAGAPRAAGARVPRAARTAAATTTARRTSGPGVRPVIDLHTHTTASDGRCTPAELVARASAAGVTVLAVTDHDTVAGGDAAAEACAAAGIEFVPGIEITAVRDGMDVHVLGYFVDRQSPGAPHVSRRNSAAAASIGCGKSSSGWPRSAFIWTPTQSSSPGSTMAARLPAGRGSPGRWWPRRYVTERERSVRVLAGARTARVHPPACRRARRGVRSHPRIGWHRLARASGTGQAGRVAAGICSRRARRARGVPHQSRRDGDGALPERGGPSGPCGLWRLGLSRRRVARIGTARKRVVAAGRVRTVGRIKARCSERIT